MQNGADQAIDAGFEKNPFFTRKVFEDYPHE